MAPERLTDLASSNPPRPGSAVSPGDVVRFSYLDGLKGMALTEGIVQPAEEDLRDYVARPVFRVICADGLTRYPPQSACTRVDPPPKPEDTSPARPFDDRKGY